MNPLAKVNFGVFSQLVGYGPRTLMTALSRLVVLVAGTAHTAQKQLCSRNPCCTMAPKFFSIKMVVESGIDDMGVELSKQPLASA